MVNKQNLNEWIIEADISRMQAAMVAGHIRSEDLVEVYLERICRYDDKLKSIIEVNPEAIEIAKSLDQERQKRGTRGPLHGIPIILKDNIDTHDKMHTSAGALALQDNLAAQDAWVASKLRAAGAILLGKANMSEWANFMSNSMWAGYSTRGGLCLNPYGPGDFFVGGSSSGSASAVAANLAAAAIGTETSGSIISPASQNSVVGIKPTHGLISRQGIIPITHSQDTAGPITRSVADAAIILGVLTGVDSRDEVTLKSEGQFCKDYTPFLDSHALKHTRIGIPRYYYKDLDPDRLSVIEAAIQVVKDQGATVIDPVEIGTEQIAWNWHVLLYEFKKGVNDYLGKLPDHIPVHSLQEVIAFNIEHSESCLKYGQDVLVQAEKTSGTLTEPAYLDSLRMNHELARDQGLEAVMKLHQLDALMFLGDEDVNDLASRAGFPVVTVPGGYALDGVIASGGYNTKGPQGISFAGIAFSEPTLIKIAYSYEQATKHRLPPIME